MEINRELLKNAGTRLGLKNKEHIEKSWMQDHLLYYLSKKRDDLVFKGGTALYKFYSLPRFSEDLDFSTKLTVDNELLKTFCEVNKISLSYKKVYGSHLYKLRFDGVLTKRNTIRLDINTTQSIYSAEPKTYIPPYPDIPPFVVKVMSLDEMLAEKVHGILNRRKARDIYDAFFILRAIDVTSARKNLIMKKLNDRGFALSDEQFAKEFRKHVYALSSLWNEELKHFVLQELPEFKLVSEFVLERMFQYHIG
jgi:predicted nucleotidyltransferase component of viral defense system